MQQSLTPAHVSIIPPPHILQRDIECFMVFEHQNDDASEIRITPNAAPGLVFHHLHGQPAIDSISTRSASLQLSSGLMVFGAGAEPSVMRFNRGVYTIIQVILKPHALNSLLRLNAAVLANDLVAIEELVPGSISYQLMETVSVWQQVDQISALLIQWLKQSNERDLLIEESLRLIHKHAASASVGQLVNHFYISERQFERRFKQVVGMSAQSYIRVKRFNQALRCIAARRYQRLTDLAHALNYHDQSHFIREMKTFTGKTPRQLLQNSNIQEAQDGYVFALDNSS
ncbi:MAG: AraC family transcriptional regulator [Anaerolineae bacterium]|nr:AraC family transcriptional regulator [Anaerolineae bacterium]